MEEAKSSQSEKTTKSLIQGIASDMQLLVEKEVALGKVEGLAAVNAESKAAVILITAAIFGVVGLSVGICAVAIELVGFKLAAILGFSIFALSSIPAYIAHSQRVINPVPETRATVKEDLEWIKNIVGKMH